MSKSDAENTYLLAGMLPRRAPSSPVPNGGTIEEEEEFVGSSPLLRSSTRNMDDLRGHRRKSPGSADTLLTRLRSNSYNSQIGVNEGVFGLSSASSFSAVAGVVGRQALPLVVSFVLDVVGDVVTLAFAGNLVQDSEARASRFAGVSLANVIANLSGISLLYGMASALETIGSQFNGSKQYAEVGYSLQLSCVLLTGLAMLIAPVWYASGDLCRYGNIDPVTCDTVQMFLRIRILNLPANVLHISYEYYLMAVGVYLPSMYSGIFFNAMLLATDYLLVCVFSLGYSALAYSLIAATYTSLVVQVLLSWNHPSVVRTMQSPSLRALDGAGRFLYLGLASTLMLCSEWWAYEVLGIMASQLGSPSLSAESILIQTEYLSFIVPLCIGYAVTSLVGNSIGAGDAELARYLGRCALRLVALVELCIGVLVYTCAPSWIALLIADEEVRAIAREAVPLLSYYAFMDCFQGIASGILRGVGKQYLGAILNLVAFYVIALPAASYLCFRMGLGVNGLMMGFCLGTTFQSVSIGLILYFCEDFIYGPTTVSQLVGYSGASDDEWA